MERTSGRNKAEPCADRLSVPANGAAHVGRYQRRRCFNDGPFRYGRSGGFVLTAAAVIAAAAAHRDMALRGAVSQSPS